MFVLVPRSYGPSDEGYREKRRAFLLSYCRVVRLLRPAAQDIVGIATESGEGASRSEDLVFYDGRDWADDEREEALRVHKLGILKNVRTFAWVEKEFPLDGRQTVILNPEQLRPPRRNDPCPCGRGKKYKKCCGRGLS